MAGIDGKESLPNANAKFDYKRDCIYNINGKCIDKLGKNYNKICNGKKICKVPWRDDGWITLNLKT